MEIIPINEVNKNHLAEVKKEMEKLGSPVIKAVAAPQWGAWVAIEGSHRVAAAAQLGLPVIIEEVEYSETAMLSDYGCGDEDDYTIADIVDSAYERGHLAIDVDII